MKLESSVLIPSFGRPQSLKKCLESLGQQTTPPDEVIVVWQGEDLETQRLAQTLQNALPYRLLIFHSSTIGIVSAENRALKEAKGQIVLLTDDDAVVPSNWIEKHLAHYKDPLVGAVGGPANNFGASGAPFPKRAVEPVGKLTWFGKAHGNLYDHIEPWRQRHSKEVDLLAGANLSFRRNSFGKFEEGLKPYWQNFEMDLCLFIKSKGHKILMDYDIIIDHFPSNPFYAGGREGNLEIKIYNSAFNFSYILSKYSIGYLRPIRLLYMIFIGSIASPGLLASVVSVFRYGSPLREFKIWLKTCENVYKGWSAGAQGNK